MPSKLNAAKGFGLQPAPVFPTILLVRILLVFLSPFRNFLAWQLLCGKSVWHVALIVERSLLNLAGWLHAPPKSRTIRRVFNALIDIRRWHLVAGKYTLNLTSANLKHINPPSYWDATYRRCLRHLESVFRMCI
jgi:hypothetical protein